MNTSRWMRYTSYVYLALLVFALAAITWISFSDKLVPVAYTESVRPVTDVSVTVGNVPAYPVELPVKLSGLTPYTPVILTAWATVQPTDSLLIKSVFAPVRLYVNDVLVYQSGQEGTFPFYMNDPPTIITTVPLPDQSKPVFLRVEYNSLTQRSTLSLPMLWVGNEGALLAHMFRTNGLSLLFSFILIFIGLIMALVSLTVIRSASSGASFLWLGLFSLSAGIWVMGECDLTAFLVPYPSLLYAMAYLGLFTVTIPLLRFGLVILNPQSKLPFQIMLAIHYASVAVALLLQLTGMVDFTKTLYWFHIIAPLGFMVFAVCLCLEYFYHHNQTARRFASAVTLLAIFTVLEAANYWFHFTDELTVFFQLGVLSFVIALGLVSGYYVRESLYLAAEKTRLEFEIAATAHHLELQREQYRKMAEDEQAVKAQRHDLRHQLAVLRELNVQTDHCRLEEYLNTLTDKLPTDKEMRLCENYAVNAVAAYYASAIQEAGIDCSIELAVPLELSSIQESDLCVIVGNLLENALDACQRMKSGQPFIALSSRWQYGTFTLALDNSFDHPLRTGSGENIFLSSKREGEGIGLASVAAVAQKYGGAARFEGTDGVFRSSVYINLALNQP